MDAKQVRLLAVGFDETVNEVTVSVRPKAWTAQVCPRCGQRCPCYDRGRLRRWRAPDWNRTKVFVVADAPRVRCPVHGVIVAAVPWARHAARHTLGFEQLAAWCAVEMSASAASRLLRCTWRTVGELIVRVADDLSGPGDGLDGLVRIGVDEISYRRGHRYLLVVVDHDRRRLVWAAKDATVATLNRFFDDLGDPRTHALQVVTADGAPWLSATVRARAAHVVICLDTFHVVRWAVEALEEVRRSIWRTIRTRRGRGNPAVGAGATLQHTRWALLKNPETLTDAQHAQLAYLATTHPQLHAAWGLKEGLRTVFTLPEQTLAIAALEDWIDRATASNINAFVTLAEQIRRHYVDIVATLHHRLTNALVESLNTKLRLIMRRGFGFRNTDALLALARLSLGGNRPALPT